MSTDTTVGFGDLLSHLNFGLMVAADAQYDRFSLLTDFTVHELGRRRFPYQIGQLPRPVAHSNLDLSTDQRRHQLQRQDMDCWRAAIPCWMATGATSM